MSKKNIFRHSLLFVSSALILFVFVVFPTPSWAVTNDSSNLNYSNLTPAVRQQMIKEIERQLTIIIQEFVNLVAQMQKANPTSAGALTSGQVTANPAATGSGSTVAGSSSSSGGNGDSGSSSGGNLPFGGLSTTVIDCNCSDNYLITVKPAGSNPNKLIYDPKSTKVYAFGQVTTPGTQLLGTWKGEDVCLIVSGDHCDEVGTGKIMVMVGTSGGSDGSGNGNTTPVTPPKASTTPPTPPTTPPDLCKRMGNQAYVYNAKGTGYYPYDSAMEGGFYDMIGNPLVTLQDYLAGRGQYVSVAMDKHTFPYGTELCIPELEQKYGRQISFRVVDTGSAFYGKGTTRIDICTANASASTDSTVNGSLTLVSKVQSMK